MVWRQFTINQERKRADQMNGPFYRINVIGFREKPIRHLRTVLGICSSSRGEFFSSLHRPVA